MKMRNVAALAATAVALVAVSAGAAGAVPVAPTAADDVLVKIPLNLKQSPETRALYGMTTIRIGNSAPIRVVVDTGSVGLRLLPTAWKSLPRDVFITERKMTWHVDGKRLRGRVGVGPFTISNVPGTEPITFMWMNNNSWAKAAAREGIQGVLGIGLSDQLLINPLTVLPGDLGRHWSLGFDPNRARTAGTGTLVLGAQNPASAIATIPLPFEGTSPDGRLYWDDQAADACWQFGTSDRICGATYFDSMAPFTLIKGEAFADLPTTKAGLLEPGTSVSMGAPGAAFYAWEFNAGLRFGDNVAKVSPRGSTLINTGSSLYSTFTVTYDAVRGVVALTD